MCFQWQPQNLFLGLRAIMHLEATCIYIYIHIYLDTGQPQPVLQWLAFRAAFANLAGVIRAVKIGGVIRAVKIPGVWEENSMRPSRGRMECNCVPHIYMCVCMFTCTYICIYTWSCICIYVYTCPTCSHL